MTKQALRPKGTEALCRLLEEPDATAALNESLLPAFPYVEPGFLRSADYRQIEQHIWTQIRSLRIIFDDVYWSALNQKMCLSGILRYLGNGNFSIACTHWRWRTSVRLTSCLHSSHCSTLDFRRFRAISVIFRRRYVRTLGNSLILFARAVCGDLPGRFS